MINETENEQYRYVVFKTTIKKIETKTIIS